ncbi:glycoside hydrolase family 113 [Maribacter sp. IgM3_T14_3]|uniref:glycoside hydrolase family 113 n=1 Tax=Maribacter sp. IgM3_T14_3 TaxID=3415140 RepID=UPI003C6F50B8
MKKKYLLVALFVVVGIVGFAGVQYLPTAENEIISETLDSVATRRDLRRSFFDKREILVVYGAKDTVLQQQYKDILHDLSVLEVSKSWRSVKVNYQNVDEVSEESLKKNIVYLVGAVDENRLIKKYITDTPFQVSKTAIRIGTKEVQNNNSVLGVSFYPSPADSKIPLSFLTGTDAEQVFSFFAEKVLEQGQSFYRQNLEYEIYEDKERMVMGDFNANWGIEGSTYFNFSTGTKVVLDTDEYQFIDHQNAIRTSEVSEKQIEVNASRIRVFDFVGKDNVPKITYNFYTCTEEKGLMTGNTDHSTFDTVTNAVHTIVNKIYENNNIGRDNALLLHNLIGESYKNIITSGLPIYFTDTWQMKGYKYWSARLVESENMYTVAELLDNSFMEMESSLIRDCMAGAFTDFLIKTWGKDNYLKRYKNASLSEREIKSLEIKWQNYLRGLPKEHPKKKTESKKLPYLKGFNFAHEGYSIYNGYGSKKATESLLKQKNMGSNAMAIVPYTGINDINTPTPLHFSDNAGSENDDAIVHAVATASDMGMYTLLKPQIYVGGSWPGGIDMPTDAQWNKFHDYYYRWIRHYAFLAEIHEMDALCIGVEFTKATLSQPDAWRAMIKKTRALYSGQLTYAANWGAEFEEIEFWNDLDFIGLNSYYPLSKKDNPTNEEMRLQFDTIKTKIKKVYDRFQKPIVFTEIGFRSVDTPWKNPHAEADDTINEEAQRRAYEIIFEGIQNEPWCQGILWWKFPSFIEYRGEHNSAFTPNNKLAEETVREWFTK